LKLVTPARPITRQLFKTEEESPDGSTGWDVVSSLTAEELNMIHKKRERAAKALSKKKTMLALTGQAADYPSLSQVWSMEVAYNMVHSMASRMRTFLWKKLLWQLRVKKAVEDTLGSKTQVVRWKRNHRWLAMLLAKEVGTLWGHYGAMRQKMNDPQVFPMM
jgi:hypothetical protein